MVSSVVIFDIILNTCTVSAAFLMLFQIQDYHLFLSHY